jgi:hypothetical protein
MQNPFIKKRSTVDEIFNNDKEAVELYNKIVELLIEAGYFRARIQNLGPFDKILGGMAWTLTGCFYDIDIDFKDDMNLTEKIRVCEKITAGLKSINCPFMISPIQIQGLDLKPIYQTLQWLVKRLFETRDERNEMNKRFSVSYIDTHIPPKQIELPSNEETILKVQYDYLKPNRKFRQKSKLSFNYNDELRIFFAMIEFGLNESIQFQKQMIELLKKKNIIESGDKDDNKKSSQPTMTGTDNTKLSKEEMKKLNEIVTANIEEISNKDQQKASASIMEAILSENMNAIAEEIENFENIKGDEEIDKIKLFVKEKERLEQNKSNIVSQIDLYQNELNAIEEQTSNENDEIRKMKQQIAQLQSTLEESKENQRKITQRIKEEKLNEQKLKFLSEKNKQKEELQANITKFKKDCRDEKKMYDAQLENYEKKIEKLNDEQNLQLFNEIDASYNAELEKNIEIKKELFEQNKEINKLTRQIQLYPSKLEIIQYQKRFKELFNQINSVSEINKQILGQSNSKQQVVDLLTRRLEEFEQLRDYYKSLKKKHDKEDFKRHLDQAHDALIPAIEKSSDRLREILKDIDDNQIKVSDYQSFELRYMKMVKEYNKEYNKYNALRK